MTRLLAVGLLVVAMSPARPLAAQSPVAPLIDEPLLAGTRLRVSSQRAGITIDIGTDTAGRPEAPSSLDGVNIQVWVLKADGTALPRRRPGEEPIRVSSMAVRNGQTYSQRLLFGFEPANPLDLDAVVVSVDGVLFVRPIRQKTTN